MLAVALAERYGKIINWVDAVEADPILAKIFDEEIRGIAGGTTVTGDALTQTPNKKYDRVISL